MININTKTLLGNVEVDDAPDTARRDLSHFATRAAQSAFGAAYAPPAQADWCDRTPAEIAVIRAMHWSGAAT
jgi:hypothetical protein